MLVRLYLTLRPVIGSHAREISFANREEVVDWMDRHQLGRRNLTPEQMSLLRGRIYNRTKKPAHGREGREVWGRQNDAPKTRDVLAEEFGVGTRTVERDGKFVETVESLSEQIPGLNTEIMEGQAKRRDINEVAEGAARLLIVPM